MNPLDRTDAERSRDLAVRLQARIRELEQELTQERATSAWLRAKLTAIEHVLKGACSTAGSCAPASFTCQHEAAGAPTSKRAGSGDKRGPNEDMISLSAGDKRGPNMISLSAYLKDCPPGMYDVMLVPNGKGGFHVRLVRPLGGE